MNTTEFVETLADLSFKDAFNPYSDACGDFDQDDAPAIRRMNLKLVLDAAIDRKVDSIWIARDLGYRGGRRTGLALTDEAHLTDHSVLYGDLPLVRATKGPALAERTASVIWQTLNRIQRPVFLWNVFPLHPHEPGDPQSNRCHTRGERNACRPLLSWLLDVLDPRVVVAVGRDAQLALADLGIDAMQVRHPSYGGQSDFISGIEGLYDLPSASKATQQLAMF
ncbi:MULTISPECIES: uracil-DNA glycosylase [Rhizobium]|uniref:uracil-DNA glycosylase n=1 Tax=Rhizobium TaxID=379 RepID=UPI001031596F|nr:MULTISPECIES: uracil-DNA glycosylase [Rhizobium]NEJ26881.1 uracil-DNA glycosylase [Rhizobium ruizarguesonis]TAU26736.1 uracil-DNA glycosylase [Rhizobium ruizarguesonis]TAU68388.1 uracil-DNA glycosylase [Rhizobium ruizarguesonis]TAW98382.1 uracil-DNA glycosylase [Rhizobium ruizarguesonis]TAY46931.1 uracil-DNA glycosylase [Rhizobium ruizarguesonis]